MEQWYEFLSVFLLSTVKFLGAPFLAKAIGFSYLQCVLVCSLGGIFGVLIFFNLGARIVKLFPNFFRPAKKETKKIFTKKNKMYVNLIRKYGVFGLAVITPVFISIPIGSFLAARFFSKQKFMITMLMVMSVVLWAVSISTFLYLI
jgi:hypothetical protein